MNLFKQLNCIICYKMGIDITGLEFILNSLKYVKSFNNLLTLGRQEIHLDFKNIVKLCNQYFIDIPETVVEQYCEKLFKYFGFKNVDSIDNSDYEKATIIHDMNKPYNSPTKYNFIFDGGCIEHIFNIPQVLENIINMLEVNGIFCSVTVNNNFSGHGFYQFSPEIFSRVFIEKYGMKIEEIYLAKVNSSKINWVNVKNTISQRNEYKFNDNEQVYILTIAKKISNTRQSLLSNFPQQYNYEEFDWKTQNNSNKIANDKRVLFISAFKDLGRSEWNHYKRTTEQYIEYFGNLLKCNLNLICFCEEPISKILNDKYNFNKTYSYDKDDTFYKYLDIDTEIINSNDFNKLIEHRKNHPECFSPEYNIVNHNKVLFIQRAKKMFPSYSHYVWIDFGYLRNSNQSIIEINENNLPTKIKYSSMFIPKLSEIPNPIESCCLAPEIIQGSMFIVPSSLVDWYAEKYTKMIEYYQSLNIVDDDQGLVLQIYKQNPEYFELYVTKEWFTLLYTLDNAKNTNAKLINNNTKLINNNINPNNIKKNKIKIGFHTNQLCERGTEIALYDYAYYNQEFYNNKSIIFYQKNNKDNKQDLIQKFEKQFKCYAYETFDEVNQIIERENIQYLYSIISGELSSSKLTPKCKNLLHAVFNVQPHGDKYATVSEYLSKKNNNQVDYVPHMINIPKVNGDFRHKYNIPTGAIVLGRYGGLEQFNIVQVYQAIKDIVNIDQNIYFLFANTRVFYEHPQIIYTDKIIDINEKVKFINTCDAMIHARLDGETFGLAVGEFSILNKPVITCVSPIDNSHIEILGDKGIYYNSYESVFNIFKNIRQIIKSKSDWNAYRQFKPENVMKKFMKTFDIPLNNSIKILYIGFWPDHKIESDHIYLNALKGNNYIIEKSDVISEQILSKYDVIICGSFLHNPQDVFILSKYYDKVIYNVTEPVEFNNKAMYQVYSKNLINLTVGCVKENETHIKYPHYMDWGLSIDKMLEANNLVSQITFEQVINKKFCCLINRHDMGKTRTDIYHKLKLLGQIDCPGNLFNNYPNEQFERIGRTNFQKEYLFSICPENFMTKNPGYVTEKLFMGCLAGTIPIYYGDLDPIDKSIFNMGRVLLFDPTSESSICNLYYKILELMTNPTKLYEFYTQPIFNSSAIQTYGLILENFKLRINNFINGKPYNQSLLTGKSYELNTINHANKINGIDHIVWINLDRSPDRRVNMEKILGQINIPNTRISAVDGTKEDISVYNYLQRPLTNYEKACVLSHIKAYSYLKNISGNYFLVLEDDINLINLKYFNLDLDKIIKQSPKFDILMIQKIHHNQLEKKYEKWNPDIYSTAAYVISKKGLEKLLKQADYIESTNKFNIYQPLSVADYFLYRDLETWVYKYNFLSTDDESSIIHPDHLSIHKNSSLVQLTAIFNDLVFNDLVFNV